MGDSPRSEAVPSRFSTPDNELDDHRFQPESLPPAANNYQRRGTLRSFVGERPTLLQVNDALQHGTVAKDYENAIVDDDKSDNGSFRDAQPGFARRGSTSPVVARRSTHRRQKQEDRPSRSRTSSASSKRTVSPPNSVDAFAGPRVRPRAGTAGTVNSLAPSMLGHAHRSSSNDTHTRTRAISDDNIKAEADDDKSSSTSAEDDVCFPQPDDTGRIYTIDFDDLHEFVESKEVQTPRPQYPRRKQSFSCRGQSARIFQELQSKATKQDIPKITKEAPTPMRADSEAATDGVQSDFDEKVPIVDELDAARVVKAESLNRWSFFSSELEESVHAPELGDLLMPGETFRQLFELGPSGGCWWLDLLYPSEEEVDVICKAFGIHGLTREDIIEQEPREKVELFKSYYFMCFRSFYQIDKNSDDYMEPVNVYAVVFREGIITFAFAQSPHASNVRRRMGKLRDYVSLSSDWICYALVDDIVDTFAPVIRSVEVETDAIEDLVFTTRPEDSQNILRKIGDCRKKVMSLIRLLGGKADVIKGFAKRCNEQFDIAPRKEVGLYLSDVQDHVVTMMGNLNHFEKMLSRSHSNYLAQVNVDNIMQGNRVNEVLGKVTFIATILVPLNLICGLFGMNVAVPGKDSEGLGWWFGILGVIVLFVVAAFGIAKKKKFI